jgi:predicted PurR-regulated permease PerM
MWLSVIALLFTALGAVLYYKMRGRSEKRWVNTLITICAFVFMIVGVVLASVAFAGGFDASRL